MNQYIADQIGLAKLFMEQNRFNDAIQICNKIINDQYNFDAYLIIIDAYIKLNQISKAEEIIHNAINLDKQNIDLYQHYANLPLLVGDFDKSIERWSTISKIFDGNYQIDLELAKLYLMKSQFNDAVAYMTKAVINGCNDFSIFKLFSDYLFNKKFLESSLIFCTLLYKSFNDNPQAVLLLVRAYKANDKLESADNLIIDNFNRFPKFLPLYEEYLNNALQMNNLSLQISRGNEFIKHFPSESYGYKFLATIYLKLGNINDAAEILYIGFKKSAFLGTDLSIDKKYFRDFLRWCNLSNYQKSPKIGLKRWFIFRHLYPNYAIGYARGAQALLDLNKFDNASEILSEAPVEVRTDAEYCLTFANLEVYRGKMNLAVETIDKLINLYPSNEFIVSESIKLLIKMNKLEKSFSLFESFVHNYSPSIDLIKKGAMLYLLLNQHKLDDCLIYIASILMNKLSSTNYLADYAPLLLTLLKMICKQNVQFSIVRRNFINNIFEKLKRNGSYKYQNSKVAFLLSAEQIPYFSELIKNFNTSQIDLIINGNQNKINQLMIEYNLSEFSYNNSSVLDHYKFVICDAIHIPTLTKDQYAIGLYHAVDAKPYPNFANKLALLIVSCKNYAKCNTIELQSDESHHLIDIDPGEKCEIAYTGAYHAAHFLKFSKAELKNKIFAQYKIDKNEKRQILFVVEDEVCLINHIIKCVNDLSKNYIIFLKLGNSIGSQALNKLAKEIFIIDNGNYSNNLLRFGSDYIFASFYSGTAMSSIMLGLNLICYYSRVVKNKSNSLKHYCLRNYKTYFLKDNYSKLDSILDDDPQQSLQYILYRNGMLFDLLNSKKINHAISTGKINKFYQTNLKSIQEKVFAEYEYDNPAMLTQKYIIDFVRYSSLKSKCNFIIPHPAND